jgi:polyisoprenoid-binding protein YceI
MRKTLLLVMLFISLALASGAAAATYGLDQVHSTVDFKIRHLVSKVSGQFTEFDATIVADFDNLDASGVEFTIRAASIDTANEKRDEHLRSPDFFDVDNHPEITFKSSKITKVDADTFAVTGTLTMRGVSKEIKLSVEYLGEMQAFGGVRAGFELTITINRKDFGVSWNRALDAGGVVLGEDVEVSITLAAVQEPAE